MGSPPAEPQRPPGDDQRIEIPVPAADEPAPLHAGGTPDERAGSPPWADADASERTVRYLMGPTAFCA